MIEGGLGLGLEWGDEGGNGVDERLWRDEGEKVGELIGFVKDV